MLNWILVCLAAIKEDAVDLPATLHQDGKAISCRVFDFSPLFSLLEVSFVTGENDNYLLLVLFPFLVSSGQSLHWMKFQRLFLWKIIPS